MKRVALILLLSCVVASLATPKAHGQAEAAAAPAAGGQAAGQAKTIWGMFGLTPEKHKACKAKFCQSGLAKMVQSMLAPMRMATGGPLLWPCCPPFPSAADLAKMTPENTPASESAAAKIKADEAGAKARRAAVKFLATVDCHYWPEAEMALIAALRGDKNECVRLEAAMALASGCCCTKKTVEALTIVVTASEKDGNPSETSERVKHFAMQALQHCVGQVPSPQAEPPELPPPSPLPQTAPPDLQPVTFVLQPSKPGKPKEPDADPLAIAQKIFAQTASTSPQIDSFPTGQRTLYHILVRARPTPPSDADSQAQAPPTPAQPSRTNILPASYRPLDLAPIGPVPRW